MPGIFASESPQNQATEDASAESGDQHKRLSSTGD
jgi:hypothetical protein